MTSFIDYPALQIPSDLVSNIKFIFDSFKAVNPGVIRENASFYSQASAQFHEGAQNASNSINTLASSWVHKNSPVIGLPNIFINSPEKHSVETTEISQRLEHIANIAELAKNHSETQVTNLNQVLGRLDQELGLETNQRSRELIKQHANDATQLTNANLDKIAKVYRDSINSGINPKLGIDIDHLPPLWRGQPNPGNIDQAGFGDCYFLSTIGELSHVNPALIKNGIKEDPNHPGNYTVSLFRDDQGKLTTQTVSEAEVKNNLRNGRYDDQPFGQQALWPYVAETAYAKLNGNGNIDIKNSGGLEHIMKSLTGKDVTRVAGTAAVQDHVDGANIQIKGKDEILSEINQALQDHRPVTLGTLTDDSYNDSSFISNGHTVYRNHAYMVLGVQDSGELLIRNPWNTAGDYQGASFLANSQDLINNTTEFAIGNP